MGPAAELQAAAQVLDRHPEAIGLRVHRRCESHDFINALEGAIKMAGARADRMEDA